jgi:hypothetical protein
MQPHHSPQQGVRSTARQFDLFVPAAKTNADQVLPQWQTLPEQTRQTLTSLLARLILDHTSADHTPMSEEAKHDV